MNKPKKRRSPQKLRVRSSAVAQVGYNPEDQTLEIAFRGGKVYRYLNVPESTYYKMLLSDSIGRFVNTQIKALYDFREVPTRPKRSKHTLH
jgi:hypothetical protein